MGYVPEWARGSQAKGSNKPEHGIKKMELFHNAPKPGNPLPRFADGGEVEYNVRGEKVGQYDGDDPIVKMRMNMTDYKGNDLRIPKSARTTQAQMEADDMANGPGVESKPAPAPAVETKAEEPKTESKPAAPSNFKSAFADARKSGAKTFEFGGKKYTTEMASDSSKKHSKTYDDLVKNKDLEIEGYRKTSENMNLDAATRADMKRRAEQATKERDTFRNASDYFKKKKQ